MSVNLTVDRHFRLQLEVLQDGSFNGSCFKSVILKDYQSSNPAAFDEKDVIDHFKIVIPYAGYTLVWEIRFDSSCPEMAPDFLFDDDTFTSFLTVDILCERVPSLANWDLENPECLRDVVQELLNVYALYKLQRLEKDGSNLGDECSKFMQEFELEERQLQVLTSDSPVCNTSYYSGSTRPPHNTVSVLFLHLEKQLPFNNIPEPYRQMALQFTFREYQPNTVLFHINPALRHLLGDQAELEIPQYVKSDGLSKYFSQFLKILHETFSQVTQNYDKRQDFHLGVLRGLLEQENLPLQAIENDMPDFTLSSYVIEVNDYPVLLIIKTPSNSLGNPKISLGTLSGGSKDIIVGSPWDVQQTVEEIFNCVVALGEEVIDIENP